MTPGKRLTYRVAGLLTLCICCSTTLFLTGCVGLLPSAEETMRRPWATFDEAKAAYDAIESHKYN